MKNYSENELSKIIFDCALYIHKSLGPGLLESAYEECMYYKLSEYDLLIEKQKPLPIIFEEVKLEIGYRVDLLVNKKVVIEIKSIEVLDNLDERPPSIIFSWTTSTFSALLNRSIIIVKSGAEYLDIISSHGLIVRRI